jgi:hypothetical protein
VKGCCGWAKGGGRRAGGRGYRARDRGCRAESIGDRAESVEQRAEGIDSDLKDRARAEGEEREGRQTDGGWRIEEKTGGWGRRMGTKARGEAGG